MSDPIGWFEHMAIDDLRSSGERRSRIQQESAMARSPGHREHPEHQVLESRVEGEVTAEVDGTLIASSGDVIRVDEDGAPPRFYFPRHDVQMSALLRTQTSTSCPFKGSANYYDLAQGNWRLKDAVWTYENPYDEHAALQDRVAFYDDKYPEIVVRAASPSHESQRA